MNREMELGIGQGRRGRLVGALLAVPFLIGGVSEVNAQMSLVRYIDGMDNCLYMDCEKVANKNLDADVLYPGLREEISGSMKGLARVLGTENIGIYFHKFNLAHKNEFNAQPEVTAGNYSCHFWVENIGDIPPKKDLLLACMHEGGHIMRDKILSSEKGEPDMPDGMRNIPHTLTILDKNAERFVREGSYTDDTNCSRSWCVMERKFGHPYDENEVFASTFSTMFFYSGEFIERLDEAAKDDFQTAGAVAQYGKNLLNVVAEYGDISGIDALREIGFDSKLVPALERIAKGESASIEGK